MRFFKSLLNIENAITVALVGIFIFFRWPQVRDSYQIEGQKALIPDAIFDVRGVPLGQRFPSALIFWASWCGPCKLELARVNRLVSSSKIKPDSVIAVSLDENIEELKKELIQRDYKFLVAWDRKGSLAKRYLVSSTPTVVVFGADQSIVWATSGLSPLLELHLLKVLQ